MVLLAIGGMALMLICGGIGQIESLPVPVRAVVVILGFLVGLAMLLKGFGGSAKYVAAQNEKEIEAHKRSMKWLWAIAGILTILATWARFSG